MHLIWWNGVASTLRLLKFLPLRLLPFLCCNANNGKNGYSQLASLSGPMALGGLGRLRMTNLASWDLATMTSFNFTAVCIRRTLEDSLRDINWQLTHLQDELHDLQCFLLISHSMKITSDKYLVARAERASFISFFEITYTRFVVAYSSAQSYVFIRITYSLCTYYIKKKKRERNSLRSRWRISFSNFRILCQRDRVEMIRKRAAAKCTSFPNDPKTLKVSLSYYYFSCWLVNTLWNVLLLIKAPLSFWRDFRWSRSDKRCWY